MCKTNKEHDLYAREKSSIFLGYFIYITNDENFYLSKSLLYNLNKKGKYMNEDYYGLHFFFNCRNSLNKNKHNFQFLRINIILLFT